MKNQDKIYKTLENKAKTICGNLWNVMSDKERNTAMLKVAITLLKECYGGKI